MHDRHRVSTDSELLRRLYSRDNDAFYGLMEWAAPQILRLARRSLREADADEVLQETFKAVFRSIHLFKSRQKGSFRGWLRTIAKHKIIDIQRRSGRSPQLEDPRIMDQTIPFDLHEDDVSCDQDVNERRQAIRLVCKYIQPKFTDHAWHAFWETAVRDRRAVDVAEELGVKPDVVRQAKRRVLVALRRELKVLMGSDQQ